MFAVNIYCFSFQEAVVCEKAAPNESQGRWYRRPLDKGSVIADSPRKLCPIFSAWPSSLAEDYLFALQAGTYVRFLILCSYRCRILLTTGANEL